VRFQSIAKKLKERFTADPKLMEPFKKKGTTGDKKFNYYELVQLIRHTIGQGV